MISLNNVTKYYKSNGRKFAVLDGISADFMPGTNVGILGHAGSGKTTFMNIVAGAILPDQGSVKRTSRVSWPTRFSSCFNNKMSGRENLLLACRLYGYNFKKIAYAVENFSEFGDQLDQPLKAYSPGMKAKLAFSLSMAIGYDFYLFDELDFKGNRNLRIELNKIFAQCKAASTLVMVSGNVTTIKEHCDLVGILHEGKITFFNHIPEALEYYETVGNEPRQLRI